MPASGICPAYLRINYNTLIIITFQPLQLSVFLYYLFCLLRHKRRAFPTKNALLTVFKA